MCASPDDRGHRRWPSYRSISVAQTPRGGEGVSTVRVQGTDLRAFFVMFYAGRFIINSLLWFRGERLYCFYGLLISEDFGFTNNFRPAMGIMRIVASSRAYYHLINHRVPLLPSINPRLFTPSSRIKIPQSACVYACLNVLQVCGAPTGLTAYIYRVPLPFQEIQRIFTSSNSIEIQQSACVSGCVNVLRVCGAPAGPPAYIDLFLLRTWIMTFRGGIMRSPIRILVGQSFIGWIS